MNEVKVYDQLEVASMESIGSQTLLEVCSLVAFEIGFEMEICCVIMELVVCLLGRQQYPQLLPKDAKETRMNSHASCSF